MSVTGSRPFFVGPPTAFSLHLPRPRTVSTSPAATVRSGLVQVSQLISTRPPVTASAAFCRLMEKPEERTLSSRREETVSRTSRCACTGAVTSVSGSGATCFGIFAEKPNERELSALFGPMLVAVTTPASQ